MNETPLHAATTNERGRASSPEEIAGLFKGLCRAREQLASRRMRTSSAFDGTVLRGPEAIACLHPSAFGTHLKGRA